LKFKTGFILVKKENPITAAIQPQKLARR